MQREHLIYSIYTIFFLLLVGAIIATPLLALSDGSDASYKVFSYTCHQMLSRSLCIFNNNSNYWISDCTPSGAYVGGVLDRTETKVKSDGAVGYKMPVCARDFGLYLSMLFAALIYPIVRKLDETELYPAIFLVLAIAPLAIDGGLQLLTEIDQPLLGHNLVPFEYESTNAMRLVTGALAGFAASFYAIPVLINIFGESVPIARKKEKTRSR